MRILGYGFERETKFVESEHQVTCYGHLTKYCDNKFPHRLGSAGCGFHEDPEMCEQCGNGYCDYHQYCDPSPSDESLTPQERNPSLVGSGNC